VSRRSIETGPGQPQTPLLHSCPAAQLLPHAPQLDSSELRSAHPVLHALWPATKHMQLEALQVAPVGHARLQRPQCAESVTVSTHSAADAQ
jgi:hypothetical protein